MKKLPWIILLGSIGAIALAASFWGWPRSLSEAGGFASMVGAILTPISLVLLVLTLGAQERARAQATRDHFLGVQVQALIALIEDDCRILDGMAARGDKSATFYNVQKRYRQRAAELNAIVRDKLQLPAMAEDADTGAA